MRKKGKIKGYSLQSGYYRYTTGEHKGRRVHRVIMENHLGRSLSDGEAVHHINGIGTDNRIENLLIMTTKDHMSLHWKLRFNSSTSLIRKGEDNNFAKLTDKEAVVIYKSSDTARNLSRKFNVTYNTILHIKKNRTWKHVTHNL